MLATGSAAAERNMVVLIDATGSMTITRPSDGAARFDAAKLLAADRVMNAANEVEGLAGGVAVYMFHGVGITAHTAGFVSPFSAATTIAGLTVTSEITPLAGSLCDTIDIASASGDVTITDRLLEVYSDGAENATDPLHACFGPFSVSTTAPFDLGSWQNKVYLRAINASPDVTIQATLFTDVSGFSFAPSAKSIDPEGAALGMLGKSPLSALTNLLSDADFFAALAQDTGGRFVVVPDAAPVPVFADVDGDFDVDRTDAIALARSFGGHATPETDLNNDGVVGYADYAILLTKMGNGTGVPDADPYVQANPFSCVVGNHVIDGKVIENAGVTLDVRGACRVTIRNSLIVSGAQALRALGATRVIVENSIIVGEQAWVRLTGAMFLTAANSVFHGAQQITGALHFDDRGGNVFE